MKKVLAIVLALVMALSMSAMAFAADETTTAAAVNADGLACPHCKEVFYIEAQYNEHLKICQVKECGKCGEKFAKEEAYNDHVQNCTVGDTKDYINLDVKVILEMIIDLVKSSWEQWGDIESVVVRLVDFIENIGTTAVGEAEVAGAVADLEAALAGVEIPGLSDLINQLKSTIKSMYAGEVATTVVEETTAAEEPVETGSSVAGIAAFAAISVAAAAAYVCTKKSK
ncbi:MAG: hypothetical protein IJ264_02710 [Clostridia bacterium]|nr:hypothetical protein [Clostridia bacterium]